MNYSVLIIDDEKTVVYGIKRVFEEEGEATVDTAYDGKSGVELYRRKRHDIVITDLLMEEMNGLEVIDEIKKINSNAVIIMITGNGSEKIASEAIKKGAYDYFSKPFNYIEFYKSIRNAKEKIAITKEREMLSDTLKGEKRFHGILYSSSSMSRIVDIIKKIASLDSSVLITGESGTGKELVAESLHFESHRQKSPFIKINCGAIPENLIEAELFGYEKGAFTGATQAKKGKFELADGGTLFLDEIGEMNLDLQVKLLRFLEDGIVEKVGGGSSKKVDVRVVAATNVDLATAVENKVFRLDLFYRLNVFTIEIPPLRERKEDLIYIAERLVESYCVKFGIKPKLITEEVKRAFLKYSWPGNVRELKNIIQNIIIFSDGEEIDISTFNEKVNNAGVIEPLSAFCEPEEMFKKHITLKNYIRLKEREYLKHILEKYINNKSEAALFLDISRKTLYEKIKEYDL